MIFWETYEPPTIITPTLKETENKKEDWKQLAETTAKELNLSSLHTECLIYYTTLYFAEEGIKTAKVHKYLTGKLDAKVDSLYSKSGGKTEFWDKLTSLFENGDVYKYERRCIFHHINVSQEVKEFFEDKNVANTISSLMQGGEHPGISLGYDKDDTIVFNLTYSEEVLWRELSSLGESDRLRILLY